MTKAQSIVGIKCKEHKLENQKPVFLLVLASLSGACGLAYEVIYARLFSNYFGDSFVISGTILCAVFFGIAVGAWQSTRFVKLLAYIEASIGIYAIFIATTFTFWGFDIASVGGSLALNAGKLVVLLFVPAFFIGTCVPLFARYVQSIAKPGNRLFAVVYGLYNLGAFLSVIAIEFFLFRQFGLMFTAYVIGVVNLVVGVCLFLFYKMAKPAQVNINRHTLNLRVVATLALVSFASGVFQLYVLRISFSIFGPLHENFAIILAAAMLGIAIGSALAMRKNASLKQAVIWGTFGLLIFLLLVSLLVSLWSTTSGLGLADHLELTAKILLLAGYPLAVFVIFGMFVPLAVQAHKGSSVEVAGTLLAVSSLANGLGALLMFLILYRFFTIPQIGFMIFIVLASSYFILLTKLGGEISKISGGALLAAAMSYAAVQLWPNIELLLGYKALTRPEEMAYRKENFDKAVTYKAFDQNASIVSFKDDSQTLILNGYLSLTFNPYRKTVLHEMIVGATPVLFSKEIGNALVFGLGSGITAGSTARFYRQTKIVEINPAILNIPKHFTRENLNVMNKKNAVIRLEDGISTLLNDNQTYDAIVNTVTSPQYYSASKLYTEDFYELVRYRLKKSGVYSSWFDLNIDREGISIMLNTLEKAFTHCRYFLLTTAYFNVACSQEPLTYLSSKSISERTSNSYLEALFRQFGFEDGFSETMSALEISFDENFFQRTSSKINSLNFPAIEFVVARASDEVVTAQMLEQTIVRNIEYRRNTAFGDLKWKRACQTIAEMSELRFEGC